LVVRPMIITDGPIGTAEAEKQFTAGYPAA
jgi:hypothetical protein